MAKQEIPLMFCFDNNYVIPAAVAFYSLLEHCNKNYYYKLYVLHTDISIKNQEKLIENIKEFSEFSELIFIDMENKFEKLWERIETKGHFSKEAMYKILVASTFPKYDKIIVSDVDVVFLNDISESYFALDSTEDYYLAGIKMIGKMKWYLEQFSYKFTKEEIEKLNGFCGGYIVFNLRKLREDNMEEKFVKCSETERNRINQPEQDVLNLCCYPKTKRLPLKYLACSYMWDIYKTEEDKNTDIYYSKEEIEDAMRNTVQLHYATSKKPWKNVDCTKSEVWFEYLMKTNFARDYLERLPNQIIPLMFCFDNNYVIPAAVAFYSLLEHCNKNYYYKLYVLHTDISIKNQEKLIENIKEFSEFSELIFVDMENKFEELWERIREKGHFSKEVMYKILVSSIFPTYDKIIVSDVDVVFLNDISESYFALDSTEDYYLAGIKMIGKMKWYLEEISDIFTEEEIEKLSGFCGGYIVFNLRKLREDNMEEKFVKCFEIEGNRINQLEQDVLNLCCYPKTKRLTLKYLACSYMWDVYKTEEDKNTDICYSKEEIEDAMINTVQLHYATRKKPWKNVDCTKSEVWFEYLMKTNFVRDYLERLPNQIILPESRVEKIKAENSEEIRNAIREEIRDATINQITEEVKKSCTIKAKINNKFSKYRLFRVVKYIFKNPLFLFKKSFYIKIKGKIEKYIQKK